MLTLGDIFARIFLRRKHKVNFRYLDMLFTFMVLILAHSREKRGVNIESVFFITQGDTSGTQTYSNNLTSDIKIAQND